MKNIHIQANPLVSAAVRGDRIHLSAPRLKSSAGFAEVEIDFDALEFIYKRIVAARDAAANADARKSLSKLV